MMLFGPERAPLAAGQASPAPSAPKPAALGPHEHALRRDDPPENAVDDRNTAADRDLAGDVALAEALLVFVAFRVAVVETTHGSVAPVDDSDACAGVDVRGTADQDLAGAPTLREHHAAE
jgi:hypothetical protein